VPASIAMATQVLAAGGTGTEAAAATCRDPGTEAAAATCRGP
jgi:hypothetical protein